MDALRDSSSFVRRAAAIALGQLQAKESQVVLLQLLEDPNFYVRRAAINAIGKLGVPDLGKVLLPLLETDDQRIRRTVITSLRRLRTLEAVPRLVEILEEYVHSPSPRDLPVVKTLVIALGELQTQEVAPVLIRVLRGYVGVRSVAAMALGQVGDHRAGPVLVESLADPSTSLRLAALKSLGNLGYVEAAPDVRRMLSFVDPRVRRVAAHAAGKLKDHEAFPILVFMAREDSSPLVRPAAVEALTSLGDEQALEPLLALVADNNAYLRASLAFAHAAGATRPPQPLAASTTGDAGILIGVCRESKGNVLAAPAVPAGVGRLLRPRRVLSQ
jgi:HEAT repeat protein